MNKKSGRPRVYKLGAKRITISLPVELIDKFKKLGSAWVRTKLQEEICNSKK